MCTLKYFSFLRSEDMDQGGGVLELHTQELKMPHAMIMQDFGGWFWNVQVCLIICNVTCK